MVQVQKEEIAASCQAAIDSGDVVLARHETERVRNITSRLAGLRQDIEQLESEASEQRDAQFTALTQVCNCEYNNDITKM